MTSRAIDLCRNQPAHQPTIGRAQRMIDRITRWPARHAHRFLAIMAEPPVSPPRSCETAIGGEDLTYTPALAMRRMIEI